LKKGEKKLLDERTPSLGKKMKQTRETDYKGNMKKSNTQTSLIAGRISDKEKERTPQRTLKPIIPLTCNKSTPQNRAPE
jgi:hypothetical protein